MSDTCDNQCPFHDTVLEIIKHLDELPLDHEPDVGILWEAIRRIEKLCVKEEE